MATGQAKESFVRRRLRADGGAWLKGALDREGAAILKLALSNHSPAQ